MSTRCRSATSTALHDLPPELRVERVALLTAFAVRAYADHARLVDADRPPRPPLPTDAFTANLVDLLAAALAAGSG